MTARRSDLRHGPMLALVALLLTACTGPGTGPAASGAASPVPSPGATPVVSSSIEASPGVTPGAEPAMAEPPAASISVEGGDPVVGQLGTFTWESGGSDAPGLDGSPIHVGVGERLSLSLAEPVGIDDWSVSRVPPGNRDGVGAVGMAHGSDEPVEFQAPPPGEWSVEVRVAFDDDRGTALYFWLVKVD